MVLMESALEGWYDGPRRKEANMMTPPSGEEVHGTDARADALGMLGMDNTKEENLCAQTYALVYIGDQLERVLTQLVYIRDEISALGGRS